MDESIRGTPKLPYGEWRWFFCKVLLVIWPILLVIAGVETLGWIVGETRPLSAIAQWQSEGPDRAWRCWDGKSYLTYHLDRIALLKPDVVVVGSSRANRFKGDQLKPYSFYTAGLSAWTIDQYRRFVELITANGYKPKVLIVNLDYWMFETGVDQEWAGRFYEKPNTHVENIKQVVDKLWAYPQRMLSTLPYTSQYQGIYAVISSGIESFGPDGSMNQSPASNDANRLINDGINPGVAPLVFRDAIDREQVEKFKRFMEFATEKQISVIGIQVPFYNKVLDGLNTNATAGSWRQFESAETKQFLNQSGMIFFDFSDVADYRDKPEYFLDSAHPSQEMMRHVMQMVVADPRVRAVLPKLSAAVPP